MVMKVLGNDSINDKIGALIPKVPSTDSDRSWFDAVKIINSSRKIEYRGDERGLSWSSDENRVIVWCPFCWRTGTV